MDSGESCHSQLSSSSSVRSANVNPTPHNTADPSRFTTYADYLKHIDPLLEYPRHRELHEYLENPRLLPLEDIKPSGWILRTGSDHCRVKDCREFKNYASYRSFLSKDDDDWVAQIIIRRYKSFEASGKEGRRPFPTSNFPFHAAEADTLGLELNLTPSFWLTLLPEWTNKHETRKLPENWVEQDRFTRIGRHYVLIPASIDNAKRKTVILFLAPLDENETSQVIPAIFLPLASLEAQEVEVAKQNPSLLDDLHGTGDSMKWLLGMADGEQSRFKTDSIPLLCTIGLLRLHFVFLESLQEGRPRLRVDTSWLGVSLKLSQQDQQASEFSFDQPSTFPIAELQRRWSLIRDTLVSCQEDLEMLPRFAVEFLDVKKKDSARVYQRITEDYRRYTDRLSTTELLVKDQIGMISSAITTEMARISIKESKRVMLLTLLAFVFLPVSLVASIFGMNIQQINESGHDIRAFVATSFVMLLSTLLLWVACYSYISVRRKIAQRYPESQKQYTHTRTWKENILFIDVKEIRHHKLYRTLSWWLWKVEFFFKYTGFSFFKRQKSGHVDNLEIGTHETEE